jgi:hypothetical protein
LVANVRVAGKNLSGAFLARRSLRSISSVAFTVDSSSKNFTLSTFCAIQANKIEWQQIRTMKKFFHN